MIPKTCCFCLSLKDGCIIASVIYFIIVITKIVVLTLISFSEGVQTVMILNITLLSLAGILLFFGAVTEDRVSIITFLCFNISAMVAEGLGLVILYLSGEFAAKVPVWLMVIIILEHVPFIYMIPVGLWEFRVLREKHLYIAGNAYNRSRRIHSFTYQTSGHPGF